MADNKIRGIINSPQKKDMVSIEGDTVFIIVANDSEKGTDSESYYFGCRMTEDGIGRLLVNHTKNLVQRLYGRDRSAAVLRRIAGSFSDAARELEGDDDQNEFMSEELRDFEKWLREKLVEEKRADR